MPALSKARMRPLITTAIIVLALIVCYLAFVQVWTRKLWFDSLDYTIVFGTQLGTQVLLFAAFFLVMAVVMAANLWIASRSRSAAQPAVSNPAIDKYRTLLMTRSGWVIAIPAVVFGLGAGASASTQAMTYLAWWNRQPFGDAASDTYFGMDSSFYVFEYPVWRDVLSFALSAIVLCLIGAAIVHFLLGSLTFGSPVRRRKGELSAARVHLSILTGLGLAVYGLQTLLDRYGFLVADGTLFTGMHYTDHNARSTAKLVMAVILFICAALFFVNTRLTKWLTPVAGLVLMVVSGLIVSLIYPAIIQAFEVRPNEPDKERPYIEKHIAATRTAFGVDHVEIESYDATDTASPGQLKDDAEALPGIRLIDPAVVGPTFEQLQQVRGYYTFAKQLAVDRYVIDGKETDAVVAARELKVSGIPEPNWNTLHTVYTHGYGLVAAYGNRRQAGGSPDWIEKEIPPEGKLGAFEGRIYFGEQSSQFAIVGRPEDQPDIEMDTPGGCGPAKDDACPNEYAGTGGVPIGDMGTRLLYATYFGDINIILSDRVNAESKLLYDRTPQQRVAAVAPWLTLDQMVYPAVVDGRLVWIVDCYTTSDSYPNSQRVALSSSTVTTQTGTTQIGANYVNYMRNSVKAVVDATNGTVDLYEWNTGSPKPDPVLATFKAAFPGTVKSSDEISEALMAHLRYPTDLFTVQRNILGRYHMTNPADWYQQSDLWQVPDDPVKHSADGLEPPYYLSIKWPKDQAPVFSLTTAYVPNQRANLASYMAVVAEATSPDYGRLRVLRMSSQRQIPGPGQTYNDMMVDTSVAALLRPYLNQGASSASFGNLLTLPIGGGLLYVLPVYTQREGNSGSYPALTFVIVRFGTKIGAGATLQEALNVVFGGNAGAETGETPVGTEPPPPTTEPTDPGTPGATPSPDATPLPVATPTTNATPGVAQPSAAAVSLQRAETAFAQADAALKNGDLAEYQRQVQAAQAAMAQALRELGR